MIDDYFLSKTFNFDLKYLPSIEYIKKYIVLDNQPYDIFNKAIKNFEIRDNYLKYSYTILNHEFLKSIKKFVNDLKIKKIVELNCGAGWLTFWSRKYNINIFECIDNKSWNDKIDYLSIVKKYDSVKYVKENKDIDLFILSWPYMDNIAEKIWNKMNKGQYLLYIGEDYKGCTANDNFFNLVFNFKIKDKWELGKNHISFWGIHDRPMIFKK